jgi:drug/metabolite transporter (DMT)-like permease
MTKLGFYENWSGFLKILDKYLQTVLLITRCIRTPTYTGLALIAFASNSIICRLALADFSIDPASFSAIRLVSGALILALINSSFNKSEKVSLNSGNWFSGAMLFLYAITFSFAYLSLNTNTGALILFGSVQITMILVGLILGERPSLLEWAGVIFALFGLIYLMIPGWESPSLVGGILMTVAGVSWGIYSLYGHRYSNPIKVTGGNFTRSVPLVLLVILMRLSHLHTTTLGVFLAVISGVFTSGLGYVIWYTALRDLSVTRAATVQLLVPIIAAIGGIFFLSESISLRLIISAIMILGGVGSCFFTRTRS